MFIPPAWALEMIVMFLVGFIFRMLKVSGRSMLIFALLLGTVAIAIDPLIAPAGLGHYVWGNMSAVVYMILGWLYGPKTSKNV